MPGILDQQVFSPYAFLGVEALMFKTKSTNSKRAGQELRVALFSEHPLASKYVRQVVEARDSSLQIVPLQPNVEFPNANIYVIDCFTESGKQLFRTLLKQRRGPIVGLIRSWEDPIVMQLLQARAQAFLIYEDIDAQFRQAMMAVCSGSFWVIRSVLARYLNSVRRDSVDFELTPQPSITRREQEVLRVLTNEGLTNKEIAARLHMSVPAVKLHVSKLLRKYGAENRADLVRRATKASPLPEP